MDLSIGFLLWAFLALAGFEIGAGFSLQDLEDLEPSSPQRVHYGRLDAKATRSLFENFIQEHNKVYRSRFEKEKRLKIFEENLRRYDAMNEAEKGTAVYGINVFSDMTIEEFKKKKLTLNVNALKKSLSKKYDDRRLQNLKIPKNFDWRQKGAVTPIKDQGFCGSCWAFSAVANLEGLYFNKYQKLLNFSEQQIVDCDKTSHGCRGGLMSNAVNYIKDAGGLETAETYPYQGEDQQCKFNSSNAVLKVRENIMLPQNERKIAAYLFKHGPVSIAVDASAMGGYVGGIAHPGDAWCSKVDEDANHGITLVGYGLKVVDTDFGKKRLPFWIAKNSWGTELCDKGYYYVYRGDNTCGIANLASTAVLA